MPSSLYRGQDRRELDTWYQDVRTVPTVAALANIPASEHAAIRTGTSTYDVAAGINQQAVDIAVNGGGTIVLGAGEYVANERILLPNGVNLVGLGPGITTLTFRDAPDGVLAADLVVEFASCIAVLGGGSTALPALATDIDQNALEITFVSDMTGIIGPGNIIKVQNPTEHSHNWFRSYYHAGEFMYVLDVAGAVVTLARPTVAAYAAADVNVYLCAFARSTISNMTILGKQESATSDPAVIYYSYATGLLVDNVVLHGSDFAHILVQQCVEFTIRHPYVRYYSDFGGTNYGININNSQDGMIEGGNISVSRHAVTHGGSHAEGVPTRNVQIVGGRYEGRGSNTNGSIAYHANCENNLIVGVEVINGITWSGHNNTIRQTHIYTGYANVAIGGSEMVSADHTFDGVTIHVMQALVSDSLSPQGAIHLSLMSACTRDGTLKMHNINIDMNGYAGEPVEIYSISEAEINVDVKNFNVLNADRTAGTSLVLFKCGAGHKLGTMQFANCTMDGVDLRLEGVGPRLARFVNYVATNPKSNGISVLNNDLDQSTYQHRATEGGVPKKLVVSYDEDHEQVLETSSFTLQATDAVYFSYTVPFSNISIVLSAVNNNAATMTWEYWNGSAWTALSGVTDGLVSGGASLAQNGNLTWTIPGDWGKAYIDYGDVAHPEYNESRDHSRLYWIRGKTNALLDTVTLLTMVTSTLPQPVTEEAFEFINCYVSGADAAGLFIDGTSQVFSTVRFDGGNLTNNGSVIGGGSSSKTSMFFRRFKLAEISNVWLGDTRAPSGTDEAALTLYVAIDVTTIVEHDNYNVNRVGLSAITETNVTNRYQTMQRGTRLITSGTAAPATGTWQVGDTMINTNPTTVAMVDRWRCTVAGTPGTWTALGGAGSTAWASITGTPTTLAGYGITDAVALAGAQTIAGVKTFSSAPAFSTMTLGSILFAGTAGALTQDNGSLFWDDTNNKMGIGINGVGSLTGKLHVVHNSTAIAYATHRVLQFTADVADPTGASNGAEISGGYLLARIAAANTSNNTNSNGFSGMVADVRTIAGATGTITNTQGLLIAAIQNVGDTILTNAYGGRVNAAINSGSGSITRYSGIAINQQTAATNNTLVLLGTLTAPSGNYGIYNSSTYANYLAGNLGIGQTTATAVLHLKAGTASASTAPLKLTSGTLLTTAEAGAIEYLTTTLYFSPAASTRRTVLLDTFAEALNLTFGTTTGTKIGTATSQKIGLWNVTPVVQPVLTAYTSDTESVVYTGAADAEAKLVDLNALRVAYEALRVAHDDLRTKLITTGIIA